MAITGTGNTAGAIATSSVVDNSNDSVNTSTTTTTHADVASNIQSNYAANIALGQGASGNTVSSTTTDFGAIAAGQAIASQGIAATASGFSALSSLTGSALLENSRGVSARSQPGSVTLAKYGAIIVGILALAWAAIAFFGRKK